MQTSRSPVCGLLFCLLFFLFPGFDAPANKRPFGDHAPCAKGRVWLAEPGKIRFSVTCRLTNSIKVARLSIVRYSSKDPGSRSDIRRVAENLRVSSADPDAGRGTCILSKEVASCAVRAHGPVKASGWFGVAKGDRCEMKIGFSVTRPPRCHDGNCEASLDVDYLWKRLPAGC
jgi:hypothetical protein